MLQSAPPPTATPRAHDTRFFSMGFHCLKMTEHPANNIRCGSTQAPLVKADWGCRMSSGRMNTDGMEEFKGSLVLTNSSAAHNYDRHSLFSCNHFHKCRASNFCCTNNYLTGWNVSYPPWHPSPIPNNKRTSSGQEEKLSSKG